MVSGDEILWMYVGNHGTARNTPNSTEEKTQKTAATRLTEKTERLRKWDASDVRRYFFLQVLSKKSKASTWTARYPAWLARESQKMYQSDVRSIPLP